MKKTRITARLLLPVLLLALLPSCAQLSRLPWPVGGTRPEPEAPPPAEPVLHEVEDPRAELLWDSYGVPHIFADDAAALFYAFGWAQMHSHADLVLRLYGQARGRAAEYWGERFAESDRWVRMNDVPGRAERWLQRQSPHMRAYMDAFIAGMNAYAERNPGRVGEEWRAVLPLTAADLLAHQQRVLHFSFLASPALISGTARQWMAAAGSNAWAISPARAAGGRAMLLANPHLPWGDLYTWYEAHLNAPGVNAYGIALVGFPILAMAFNDHLGWAHTVNTIDAADVYELTLSGDGYVFDGEVRAFDVRMDTLRVRQADGTVTVEPMPVRSSIHGPVFAERQGRALALRVAGLDAHALPEQYWDMARSETLAQFEAALSRLQLPMFTVKYADRTGNILHVFNGTVPVRSRGDWDYWRGIVPGDSSATLWTQVHPYFSLPRVLNPVSGWLHNANDPPWTTTIPFPLEPAFYPPYMAPQRPMGFRPQRSVRMLVDDPRISFDEMIAYKHSARMEAADHLVQDVVAAARTNGDVHAREAAAVLERWDRTADAGSRGGVLFQAFFRELGRHRWPSGSMFEVAWSPRAPLTTPDGLSDPATAVSILSRTAQAVRDRYGSLDIAWGEVHRFRRDSVDLPASGGAGDLGIFRVVDFEPVPGDSTRAMAVGGDSFIMAVEFADPVRARTLMPYGNASQTGSPHRTDQLELYARGELRPVFLTRQQVLNNLSRRETF